MRAGYVTLFALALTASALAQNAGSPAFDTPRPIEIRESVWLEELTWMEVRDLMKAGKTTIIIPTGGVIAEKAPTETHISPSKRTSGFLNRATRSQPATARAGRKQELLTDARQDRGQQLPSLRSQPEQRRAASSQWPRLLRLWPLSTHTEASSFESSEGLATWPVSRSRAPPADPALGVR